MAFENAELPTPLGLTVPIPVITTRRFTRSPRILRSRLYMNGWMHTLPIVGAALVKELSSRPTLADRFSRGQADHPRVAHPGSISRAKLKIHWILSLAGPIAAQRK